MNLVSFVYCNMNWWPFELGKFMSKILPLTIFDFTTWLSASPTNIKRQGAKRYPCLTPCKIGKNDVATPLRLTKASTSTKRIWTICSNLGGNPILWRYSKMNDQETLSYGLAKSNFKQIRLYLEFFAQLRISWRSMTLSNMYLNGKNVFWSRLITSIKID